MSPPVSSTSDLDPMGDAAQFSQALKAWKHPSFADTDRPGISTDELNQRASQGRTRRGGRHPLRGSPLSQVTAPNGRHHSDVGTNRDSGQSSHRLLLPRYLPFQAPASKCPGPGPYEEGQGLAPSDTNGPEPGFQESLGPGFTHDGDKGAFSLEQGPEMFNSQDQECHKTITGSTIYPSYHQHYIPPHSQQQGSRQMVPGSESSVMDNGGIQGPIGSQSNTPGSRAAMPPPWTNVSTEDQGLSFLTGDDFGAYGAGEHMTGSPATWGDEFLQLGAPACEQCPLGYCTHL